MIRSVEIKNLRGIQEGKLDDLTPLTVLVGPNGTGKSTILEALFIGSNPRPSEVIKRVSSRKSRIEREIRWLLWRAILPSTAHIKVETRNERNVPRVREIELRSALSVNTQNEGGLSGGRGNLQRTGDESFAIEFHIVGMRGNEVIDTLIGSVSDSGASLGAGQIFPLPGVEDIHLVGFDDVESAVPLDELYTEALELGQREVTRAIIVEVIPGAINIELGAPKGVPRLYVVYKDRSVPVDLAGDGIKALVRICFELASKPDGVVLLEEPEVHQHPRAISQSARAIWAAVRRGIQVIITTHSLELIDALLTEARDDQELTKLSLYRTVLKDGCLRSSRIEGSEVALARADIGDDLR